MIIAYLLSLVVLGLIIVSGGLLCHWLGYKNESWRKLTHATHGIYIGVLPFFTDIWFVLLTESVFLLSMVIARYAHEHYDREHAFVHYLGGMYRVGRESYGEFTFPIGIMIAVVLADSLWIYLAGVLVLALADALAAVVGKRFGKHPYKILGQNKSFQGSAAFMVVALLVLLGVLTFGQIDPSINMYLLAIGLAAVLTAVENLGVYGSDNLLLPVLTVAVLNVLS